MTTPTRKAMCTVCGGRWISVELREPMGDRLCDECQSWATSRWTRMLSLAMYGQRSGYVKGSSKNAMAKILAARRSPT